MWRIPQNKTSLNSILGISAGHYEVRSVNIIDDSTTIPRPNDLEDLSRRYTSRIYEMYLKVSWDRLRDKDCYKYDDYDEYTKLKENEIRESFVFEDSQEVDSFYNDFIFIVFVNSNCVVQVN